MASSVHAKVLNGDWREVFVSIITSTTDAAIVCEGAAVMLVEHLADK